MKILIYTFWIPHRPICKALFELKEDLPQDCKVLYASGDRGLKTLENQIISHKPEYILGLGYYGNSKKIRSEQEFKNIYGKKIMYPNEQETLKANWDLVEELELEDIIKAYNAGNSRCNQYAYLTMRTTMQNNLSSKFAYLHIPRSYKAEDLKELFLTIINHNIT